MKRESEILPLSKKSGDAHGQQNENVTGSVIENPLLLLKTENDTALVTGGEVVDQDPDLGPNQLRGNVHHHIERWLF